MAGVWAMAIQAAAASTQPVPITFDLAAIKPAEARCGHGGGGEIVVCGRKADKDQLRPIVSDYAVSPIRAEIGLGGGALLSAHVDRATVGGFTSPRAMVTLSIPFGNKGKK